ncbi:hypothetical protein MIR68_006031 [Amoeboaphelidium protococcarum]|nr:hypothetical protein MIR68_006031 [Amoeboaphelidium protococcarum]
MLYRVILLVIYLIYCVCGTVVEITDSNFDGLVVGTPGEVQSSTNASSEWLILLYANWCGYCRQFKTQYYELDDRLTESKQNFIKIGQVDIDQNPGVASRFYVSYLPSLYHIHNRTVRSVDFRDSYFVQKGKQSGSSGRDAKVLYQFIVDKQWQKIAPWSPAYIWSPFSLVGKTVGWCGYVLGNLHLFVKNISAYSVSMLNVKGGVNVGVEALVFVLLVAVLTVAIFYIFRTLGKSKQSAATANGVKSDTKKNK